MRRTARQLKQYDCFNGVGVLSAEKTDRGTMHIAYIGSNGRRDRVDLPLNTIIDVSREGDADHDPTNNPYWWGLEAERERGEDARAAYVVREPDCTCAYLNPCWNHRVEAARNVAHRGANAYHRELHRAHND